MDVNLGTCCICNKGFYSNFREKPVKLYAKGVEGINHVSETRGDNLVVKLGDVVHKECRKDYTHPTQLSQLPQNDPTFKFPSTSTRSKTMTFNFKANCFLCGYEITDREKREYKYGHVKCKYREVDDSMERCFEERNNDEWATVVKGRIAAISCLRAEDVVYHTECNTRFRTKKSNPRAVVIGKKRGRPSDVSRETAFLEVANHFKENDEEQFTLADLTTMMDNMLPNEDQSSYCPKWMQEKLLSHFTDQIVISNIEGRANVVTFLQTASKILHDFHSDDKTLDDEEEKSRVVMAAAQLIKNDIKALSSDMTYPAIEDLASTERCLDYLPKTLRVMLDTILVGKNKSTKTAFIGQAIMQQARPRALIAPLQVGVAVQMHHQFASRFLNDSLYAMGFAASYSEVCKFERSAVALRGTDIDGVEEGCFMQHIADNVDHNSKTLDGYNTAHLMGIIACVTPGKISRKTIPRLAVSVEDIMKIGGIEKLLFTTQGKVQPQSKFEALTNINSEDPTRIIGDLWKCAWLLKSQRPLWNGFMQLVNKGSHPGKSKVVFMPMIDMPASDMSCILSTMEFVYKQAKQYDQTPILTFDQPLYWKANEIQMWYGTDHYLNELILLLGNFHTRMSFMGSIGHFMTGSGLQEVINLVYAENSIPVMMAGKAYSRAIRALILVTSALYTHIMSTIYNCPMESIDNDENEEDDTRATTEEVLFHIDNGDQELQCVGSLLTKVMLNEGDLSTEEIKLIQSVVAKIENFRGGLSGCKTAQLWFQFIDMTEIMLKSITAQRTGNWLLHLQSVSEMLPYFSSSGHFLYAKSGYLYLQKMKELKVNNPGIFKKFVDEGLHVIRRSDRFWAGLSSDLVIEQVLMRSMKTSGGLTRGRGMTEVQRIIWVLSSPICASVNEALQTLTRTQYQTSEQHKEESKARYKKDYADASKIARYFDEKSPFAVTSDLLNLETGEVADARVNVYDAKKVGEAIVSKMAGVPILTYSFKRKDMVVLMKGKSTVTIDEEVITVDPALLFQRLLATAKSPNSCELENAFKYELSTIPSSLFGEDFLMRKANKPQLGDQIWNYAGAGRMSLPEGVHYVLDGGWLLFRIPRWTKGTTFENICKLYKEYVIKNYGDKATVVFDGGYNVPSTKDTTHLRRLHGKKGKEVRFNKHTKLNMKKDEFLINRHNKQHFLEMATEIMNDGSLTVIQAPEDADLLIVKTALKLSESQPVAIIGEDTDLLAITLQHATDKHNIFLTAPAKLNAKTKTKFWDIAHVRSKLGDEMCRYMAIVHALLGCDTTSRIQSIGKRQAFLKLFNKSFQTNANTFYEKSVSPKEVIEKGEKLLLMIYGGKEDTLDKMRYTRFFQKVVTSIGAVEPDSLGPTSDAASFHSMRVYHQVQAWLGNNLPPENWGWYTRKDGLLMPIMMSLPPAPHNLLKLIRCGCQTDCRGRCTCFKFNLRCSYMCLNCKGVSCLNGIQVDEDEEASRKD